MPGADSNRYYTTKDLENYTQATTSQSKLITVLASWHDYQTDRTFLLTTINDTDLIWLDKDATSTETEPIEAVYVVSDATVNYYKYPIAQDAYKLGRYLAGDRVFVAYRTVRNNHWVYTD